MQPRTLCYGISLQRRTYPRTRRAVVSRLKNRNGFIASIEAWRDEVFNANNLWQVLRTFLKFVLKVATASYIFLVSLLFLCSTSLLDFTKSRTLNDNTPEPPSVNPERRRLNISTKMAASNPPQHQSLSSIRPNVSHTQHSSNNQPTDHTAEMPTYPPASHLQRSNSQHSTWSGKTACSVLLQ